MHHVKRQQRSQPHPVRPLRVNRICLRQLRRGTIGAPVTGKRLEWFAIFADRNTVPVIGRCKCPAITLEMTHILFGWCVRPTAVAGDQLCARQQIFYARRSARKQSPRESGCVLRRPHFRAACPSDTHILENALNSKPSKPSTQLHIHCVTGERQQRKNVRRRKKLG